MKKIILVLVLFFVFPIVKIFSQDIYNNNNNNSFDISFARTVYRYHYSATERIESFFDFLYDYKKNPFYLLVVILTILFFFSLCIYILQLMFVFFGLFFKKIKQKQTVKYLLIPYGFICTLKKLYKDLK